MSSVEVQSSSHHTVLSQSFFAEDFSVSGLKKVFQMQVNTYFTGQFS